MKHFNWNRFRLTLCYDFTTGRRMMLRSMMYMLLAYLFIFFVFHVFNTGYDYDEPHQQLQELALMRIQAINQMVVGLAIVMGGVYALVTVCGMFNREQDKQGRLLTLMLPASNLEKFLSRWVFMLALTLAGTVVVFPVADLLHILYCWMRGMPAVSALPAAWDNLASVFFQSGAETQHPALLSLSVVMTWLRDHALFLLGACLFRRHTFLLTASSMAILAVVTTSFSTKMGFNHYVLAQLDTATDLWPILGSVATSLLIVGACYWAAFRLFCRWQVVTHKFLNL